MTMTTVPMPNANPSDLETVALTFAQAHHHWLTLSAKSEAWTKQGQQRALAAAFLRFHAAKLALSEVTGEFGSAH